MQTKEFAVKVFLGSPRRAVALLVVWAPIPAGVTVLVGRLLESARRSLMEVSGPSAFADLVTASAGVVVAMALAWLSVAVTACLLAETGRRGAAAAGRVAAELTPRHLRMLVRVACGVAVAAPFSTVPAHAAVAHGHACGAAACSSAVAGLPLPDRPGAAQPTRAGTPVPGGSGATGATGAAGAAGAAHPAGVDPPATVTVRPGDSLWSIAAAQLPPGASPDEVASAWPRWFAANRDVIGDDPHLIHPGTTLTAPSGAARS